MLQEENNFKYDPLDYKALMIDKLDKLTNQPYAPALKTKAKKIFIQNDKEIKSRKVNNLSEVSYFKQTYLIEKNSQFLLSVNNSYKNEQKIDISKAKIDQTLDRDCILELHDEAVCYFILTSDTNDDVKLQIKQHSDLLIKKFKKDNKDFESKSDEEKLLLIPSYENILVIKYFIKLVVNRPIDRKTLKSFNEIQDYINYCISECKYYCSKKNYKEAEKICNLGLDSVRSIDKNTKKTISELDFKSLEKQIKPLLSNKSLTFYLRAKLTDEEKLKNDYFKNCQKVNEEYFELALKYPLDYPLKDEITLKIILRQADCYLKTGFYDDFLKEISKAQEFEQIKTGTSDNNPCYQIYCNFSQIISERKQKPIANNKKTIKSIFYKEKPTTLKDYLTNEEINQFKDKYHNYFNEETEDENSEFKYEIEWDECTDKINYEKNIPPAVLSMLSCNRN